MEVFDLEMYVVNNGLHVKGNPLSYDEYRIDNEYIIKLVEYDSFRQLRFMVNGEYVKLIDTINDKDEIKELERLLEECNDIKEVMDCYLDMYLKKKRIEAEEKKKLDNFMLKKK